MALGLNTLRAIQNGVDAQVPFKNSTKSIIGIKYDSKFPPDMGRLPMIYRDILTEQCKRGYVRYIIFSYNTPIAWALFGGKWEIPDVRYSKSTTHHQNSVGTATQNFDFYNKLGNMQ